jgi:hypothetical protein
MIRVLICGSRDWSKPIPIDVLVAGLGTVYGKTEVLIIHGAAPGADTMAGESATRFGMRQPWTFPARWDVHDFEGRTPVPCWTCKRGDGRCRAAGVRRNQLMLDQTHPDVVYAFTNDIKTSKGTADMLRRAHAAGVPCYVEGKYDPPSLANDERSQAMVEGQRNLFR